MSEVERVCAGVMTRTALARLLDVLSARGARSADVSVREYVEESVAAELRRMDLLGVVCSDLDEAVDRVVQSTIAVFGASAPTAMDKLRSMVPSVLTDRDGPDGPWVDTDDDVVKYVIDRVHELETAVATLSEKLAVSEKGREDDRSQFYRAQLAGVQDRAAGTVDWMEIDIGDLVETVLDGVTCEVEVTDIMYDDGWLRVVRSDVPGRCWYVAGCDIVRVVEYRSKVQSPSSSMRSVFPRLSVEARLERLFGTLERLKKVVVDYEAHRRVIDRKIKRVEDKIKACEAEKARGGPGCVKSPPD